jgi:hypothetical protein
MSLSTNHRSVTFRADGRRRNRGRLQNNCSSVDGWMANRTGRRLLATSRCTTQFATVVFWPDDLVHASTSVLSPETWEDTYIDRHNFPTKLAEPPCPAGSFFLQSIDYTVPEFLRLLLKDFPRTIPGSSWDTMMSDLAMKVSSQQHKSHGLGHEISRIN